MWLLIAAYPTLKTSRTSAAMRYAVGAPAPLPIAIMTGRAPPIAVSGAAAAMTRKTIPTTPMDPRNLPAPPVVVSDMGSPVGVAAAAGGAYGHDRPVLRARDVCESERVPHHDVLVLEIAVAGDEARQTGAAGMLVHEIACRVPFGGVELRHPQVLGGERRPRRDRRIVVGEQD